MQLSASEFLDLIWALLLVLINGYFVAVEFAIVRSRRTRIEQFVQQGSRRARYAMDVINSIDGYLSATQLGITLASLGLGWMAQRSIMPLVAALFGLDHGVAKASAVGVAVAVGNSGALLFISGLIAFLLVTFVQIVFGELAPKSLAIVHSERWLMNSALSLRVFYRVMFPVIWLLNASASGVLRVLRAPLYTGAELAHSEEELRMLVSQSHESGVIDATEHALFDNVFTFGDRVAREIMVPRTDMVCLFTDESLAECLTTVQSDQHTRFPLCVDDKDHVIGIIHSKDLYSLALRIGLDAADLEAVTGIARKVVSVPEAMGIDEVLKVLQRERSGMAIVIDEYGGTAGMVTLEDVLEELVGEIQDEFDEERPPIEELDGYFSIDARLLIEEVNDLFNFSLSDEEVDTVGGWVYAELTEPLKTGLAVQHGAARFVVAEIDNLRITRVHVYLPSEAGQDDGLAE